MAAVVYVQHLLINFEKVLKYTRKVMETVKNHKAHFKLNFY